MTRREVLAVGLQDDDPDRLVRGGLHEQGIEQVEHLRCLGVRLVGTIQRDHGDALVDHLVQHQFVTHAMPLDRVGAESSDAAAAAADDRRPTLIDIDVDIKLGDLSPQHGRPGSFRY